MKEIRLTRGRIALVDDEDYDSLNKHKWIAHKQSSGDYAVRSDYVNGSRVSLFMHRIIMDTPQGLEVDHIDHNGLNNQKSNLRNCTRQENQRNKRARSLSGYLGVAVERNRFRATIQVGENRIYLGIFKTAIEAAYAYDKSAIEHFGVFANLNFKDKLPINA